MPLAGALALALAPSACSPPRPQSAEALVKRMSDRLSAAQSFSFNTQETHQQRRGGTVREISRSRAFLVRRPGSLSFRSTGGPLGGGSGTYDGQRFTLVWPDQKAYARVRMPATLDAALDRMAEHFNTPLPVGDLLYSSAYDALVSPHSSGRYAGRETLNGTQCDHVAFTHARVDWELWVAVRGEPLPCRIRITTKGASGPLTSEVQFKDWNLQANLPADAFQAPVPADYERIPVAAYAAPEEAAPPAATAAPAPSGKP